MNDSNESPNPATSGSPAPSSPPRNRRWVTPLLPWAALALMLGMLLYGLGAQRRIALYRRQARQAERLTRELPPLEERWRTYSEFKQRVLSGTPGPQAPFPFSLDTLSPPDQATTNRVRIAPGISAETFTLSWDRANLARLTDELNALGRRHPFTRIAALRIDPSFRSDRARILLEVETITAEDEEPGGPRESRAGN